MTKPLPPLDRAGLLKMYDRAVKASIRAAKKASELREALAINCDHPEEYRSDFEWEHDNGYGRQTRHTSKLCDICGAENRWGHWSKYE